MISIQEALQIVQKQPVVVNTCVLNTQDSLSYCLAEDIFSPINIPSFDNSAMDGFAVCGIHLEYQIVGEIQAGNTSDYTLKDQEAFRIFTGARIPRNTTSIIMQEQAEVRNGTLFPKQEVIPNQHIRKAGIEVQTGDLVFPKGHQLNAASIGFLISLGISKLKLIKKPKLSIIVTGNELVETNHQLEDGQIYESNSYTLINALKQIHLFQVEKYQVKDSLEATIQQINSCLEQSDLTLISGGISVGDYDFVKAALERNQVSELFYKVKQKPGKPLWFGRKKEKFVFALPGNPASALSCFYVHVIPLIDKLQGKQKTEGLNRIQLPLKIGFNIKSDRPSFLKAHIEDRQVTILNGQGSSMIKSLAESNALVYFDGFQNLNKGTMVECILLP